MAKRKVLITGAAGRIGQVLREGLKDRYELRLLYNRTVLPARDGEEVFVSDITDLEKMEQVVDGCDAVIHMAGNPEVGASFDGLPPPEQPRHLLPLRGLRPPRLRPRRLRQHQPRDRHVREGGDPRPSRHAGAPRQLLRRQQGPRRGPGPLLRRQLRPRRDLPAHRLLPAGGGRHRPQERPHPVDLAEPPRRRAALLAVGRGGGREVRDLLRDLGQPARLLGHPRTPAPSSATPPRTTPSASPEGAAPRPGAHAGAAPASSKIRTKSPKPILRSMF